MISPAVLQALSGAELPCFVYDAPAIGQRAAVARSLVDRCFFPVKACPEPEVIRMALATGCDLDLCSPGDVDIAEAVGCPGKRWKFTSPCDDERLLHRLCAAGGQLDADTLEQALRWKASGGKACGLRLSTKRPHALYGPKFGMPPGEVAIAVKQLGVEGLQVDGLHLHDQHANLTPMEFVGRLFETLKEAGPSVLENCRYVNIGGSWPMRHGVPAAPEDLRAAFTALRGELGRLGFQGQLWAEPGRWAVGPCGFWAARVAALKPHPLGASHKVVILDTSTPIPCRPSLAPFVVLRGGAVLKTPRAVTCDIYGAANTALDILGHQVRLPDLAVGDTVVSLGQGAYTRTLIPPFNERKRPAAIMVKLPSDRAGDA